MNMKTYNSLFFRYWFIFAFIFLGFTFQMNAQEQKQKRQLPAAENYTVKKAVSKIKVDGVLNEEAWKHPEKINTFFEWLPGDNIPAPVKTECLVTFDQSKFYVAFRCFDPEPKKIRAHLIDRDSIDTFIQDDHVNFMVDTFNDERRGFQFRINPLGVQADAIFSELEGYEDFSWDAIWKSAGKITDFGYVVEVAIPFNQLRFPKDKGVQTWGFSAARSYPRNVRHRLTSHVRDRNKSCILCQFNKLTGFEGISPGKNIELDPTLTAMRTDSRDDFPAGDMEAGSIDLEPGITSRWGITPNLMLNATINPDFSQVEADVAQLEVNTRFALHYPEKRPFFLEGADFFLTPFKAVFTRTVFNPIWGAKVTGKMGKNAIGVFVTQDKTNNLLFPSNQFSVQTSMDKDVFGGVVRYRRDVGKGSTIGLLYTGRVADDYFNHMAGVDGFFRLSNTKTLNVQYLRSETDYQDQMAQSFDQSLGAFAGNALYARFEHRSRNMYYRFKYEDLSPGFRADFGFIPRVDTRKFEALIHPIIWGKRDSWFDMLGFMVLAQHITDHDNNTTDQTLLFATTYTGFLQSYLELDFFLEKELWNGEIYNKIQFAASGELKPTGGVKLSFNASGGDIIDYWNFRMASYVMLNPGIEFGIGKHLNVNLNHLFQRLSLAGDKIYAIHLFQTKLIYNFNVRTFVRAIVQYQDIDRNVALHLYPVEATEKTLFTQFLFSYKINPQTVLFIGYSDNNLGLPGIEFTRTNRTFFLKIGYALVL